MLCIAILSLQAAALPGPSCSSLNKLAPDGPDPLVLLGLHAPALLHLHPLAQRGPHPLVRPGPHPLARGRLHPVVLFGLHPNVKYSPFFQSNANQPMPLNADWLRIGRKCQCLTNPFEMDRIGNFGLEPQKKPIQNQSLIIKPML